MLAIPDISWSTRCYAGGLAGYNNRGTIRNCYATSDVNSTSTAVGAYAGGLVGGNFNLGTIIGCYATGDASAVGASSAYAGGLVGRNENSSIQNSYATGDVSAESGSVGASSPALKYAGGLVGYTITGPITGCYATGSVYAETRRYSACYAGGFAGFISSGAVTACFAAGNVTAESGVSTLTPYAGGFSGSGAGANCYRYAGQTVIRLYTGGSPASPSNTLGVLCTADNISDAAFFTETLNWSADVWDFSDLDFAAGKYPKLK